MRIFLCDIFLFLHKDHTFVKIGIVCLPALIRIAYLQTFLEMTYL